MAWTLFQHVVVKGLFAVKFLLAARWLGPEKFGLLAVALSALAIVESLSDTGLAQAVIQRDPLISSKEAGAVLTLQFSRGVFLFLSLLIGANLIADLFNITESESLIAVAAFIPLVRNALNLGFTLLVRSRNFRALAVSEITISFLDTAISIILLHLGVGPIAILIGTLTGDSFRIFLSWSKYRFYSPPNFHWREISFLGRFGIWIWLSSILTIVLNQFDKIVVARWLGTSSFGIYQASSRLAQLGVSDVSLATGQYFFPTMAQLHHSSPESSKKYFYRVILKMALFSGVLCLFMIFFASIFLDIVLGSEWASALPILRVQCVAMWFGSLIVVCVAYLKAVGCPKIVVQGTLFQLFFLVVPSYWVIRSYGALGMSLLVAIALSLAFTFMFLRVVFRSSSVKE